MVKSDKRVMAALASVGSNTILVILKIVVGLAIGSVSIISEAIHSGIDLIASFMDLFAVRTSSRPPDKEHNFGHGKIENVSGTLEAILIFVAAVLIVKEAVGKMSGGGAGIENLGWGIAIMGYSALQNLVVSQYMLKVARKTGSIAVEADAMHLRTDVYTSAGVFVGLLLIKLTGYRYTIIDPIAAIFVAMIIVKAAYDLTKKAFIPLIDTALTEEEVEQIKNVLQEYNDNFISYHDMRTRRAGRECHIDLHLVTCPEMSVKDVHDLCDEIEAKLMQKIPFCQVLIHVEPDENNDDCTLLQSR